MTDESPRIHLGTETTPIPLRQVEGREWWLWGFAVAVTLVLTFGLLSLTFPGFHLRVDEAPEIEHLIIDEEFEQIEPEDRT